jgi:hypothetical protein
MSSSGSYRLQDVTEAYEFPVPQATWADQPLGDGLDGVPALNAYRLHTWRWQVLSTEEMAKLVLFQARQQSTASSWRYLETDPYDPACNTSRYGTVTYTDVTIKSIVRDRGFPNYENVTIVFEVLVTGTET